MYKISPARYVEHQRGVIITYLLNYVVFCYNVLQRIEGACRTILIKILHFFESPWDRSWADMRHTTIRSSYPRVATFAPGIPHILKRFKRREEMANRWPPCVLQAVGVLVKYVHTQLADRKAGNATSLT